MTKQISIFLFILFLQIKPHFFLQKIEQTTFLQTNLKKDETYKLLRKIEEIPLGKKVLETVFLQLKNDAPLSEISKLLTDLKQELERQQSEEDKKWILRESDCKEKSEEYSQRIVKSSLEIEESEFNIKRIADDLFELKKVIKYKSVQLSILSEKEETIKNLREQDADDYEVKITQINEILSALTLILPKLLTLKNDSFESKEMTDVLSELSQIGKTNPINAFVQFSMTLEPEQIEKIIEKIEKIIKSLQAALEDEKTFESNAISNSKLFITEIEETKKNLADDLKSHQDHLNELENNKKIQERRRDNNKLELDNSTIGKSNTIVQCENLKKNYSENSLNRKKEISIIQQTEMILAARLEVIKKYVAENTNAENGNNS